MAVLDAMEPLTRTADAPSVAHCPAVKRRIQPGDLVRVHGYRFFAYLELAMKETSNAVVETSAAPSSWWNVVCSRLPPPPATSSKDCFLVLRTASTFAGPWKDCRACEFVVRSALACGDAHPVTSAIARSINAASSFEADIGELIRQINDSKHTIQSGQGRESLESIVGRVTERMQPMFRQFFSKLLRDMPSEEAPAAYDTAAPCLFSRLDPRRDHSALFLLSCSGDLSHLPLLR